MLRAFDLRNGKVLWTFKTGNPIASGPTIFAAGGREYVAVTVGGTPTSSNGGTVSQLFVFTLGTGTTARTTQSVQPAAAWPVTGAAPPNCPPHARRQPVAAFGSPSAAAPSRSRSGEPTARTKPPSRGASRLRGKPVAGAVVAVDRYRLPRRTDAQGRFSVLVDSTLARRHPIHVADRLPCNRGRAPADRRREEDVAVTPRAVCPSVTGSSVFARSRRRAASSSPGAPCASMVPPPPESSCSRIACRGRSRTRAGTPCAARPSSRGQPIETSGRSPSLPTRTATTSPTSPPPTRQGATRSR